MSCCGKSSGALKFGAFDYVYEWHDLFSRIEDLFKDPVKDH